ncbi:hypothetical protein EDC01DRAFT_671790 [Geopyxis carbonaria]|nr:hypothetical protein EDC01DRAFT_671790 [Geopyxis carbonaria]
MNQWGPVEKRSAHALDKITQLLQVLNMVIEDQKGALKRRIIRSCKPADYAAFPRVAEVLAAPDTRLDPERTSARLAKMFSDREEPCRLHEELRAVVAEYERTKETEYCVERNQEVEATFWKIRKALDEADVETGLLRKFLEEIQIEVGIIADEIRVLEEFGEVWKQRKTVKKSPERPPVRTMADVVAARKPELTTAKMPQPAWGKKPEPAWGKKQETPVVKKEAPVIKKQTSTVKKPEPTVANKKENQAPVIKKAPKKDDDEEGFTVVRNNRRTTGQNNSGTKNGQAANGQASNTQGKNGQPAVQGLKPHKQPEKKQKNRVKWNEWIQ